MKNIDEKFDQLGKKIIHMHERIWRPSRGQSNWSATFLLDEIREEWVEMEARLHYLETILNKRGTKHE